ncbi:hypothetical protein VHEMI02771 [[Torrubiella] hemipterigena]|uniref:Uncharacterized protein n=1 Tax=[Torrubiella] hemipterigena TaxID=1531966 RepID=A0A0A1T8X8_9HYPO|nr:hypothetical protein VHEMI02771 [[Torrubiella] hemipterigena]
MFASKFLALATLVASVVAQGIVEGSNPDENVSYTFEVASRQAACPKLQPANVEDALKRFNGLVPPAYTYGKTSESNPHVGAGALYLSYPEGTFAFTLTYDFVVPNATDTWVEKGADIANVYTAIREDVVKTWAEDTFQWKSYNVSKITDDAEPKHAGVFTFHISTPSFVKGCDTTCGGTCNPNNCKC